MINDSVLDEIKDLEWCGGGIPHPLYNITGFRHTLMSLATGKKFPKAFVDLSSCSELIDSIVVIAFDSINYELFSLCSENLHLDGLIPITSVFPTTSTVAWKSIYTGLSPAEHGIYGVTFFSKEFGSIYSMYHRLRDLSAQYRSVPDNIKIQLFPPRTSTFVKELRELGWRCCIVRDQPFAPYSPSIMMQQEGAETVHIAPFSVRNDPERMVCLLAEKSSQTFFDHFRMSSGKLLVWIVADFDAYLHDTLNFVPGIRASLDILYTWINSLTSRTPRTAFLFISDHGQISQNPSIPISKEIENIFQNRDLCYAHRAGAGRTVYVYPHAAREIEVKKLLNNILSGHAVVITRDEAKKMNLYGKRELVMEERVGGLIVIAQSPHFPAHSLGAYHEHGSLSWDELIVPFGWKLPI